MSAVVPDAIEPIEAWRAWSYSGGQLQSPIRSSMWVPGVVFEAECNPVDIYSRYPELSMPLPGAPHENCCCGVYALYHRGELPAGDLYGKVTLWGKVIRGTKGVRGQYAYPSELYVPASMLGEAALRAYGVPIFVGDAKTIIAFRRFQAAFRRFQAAAPVKAQAPIKLQAIDGGLSSNANDDPLLRTESASVRFIRNAVAALDTPTRRIIELRYGLAGDPPMTLEEIGRMLGVTAKRVRALENNALRQMRQPSPMNPSA